VCVCVCVYLGSVESFSQSQQAPLLLDPDYFDVCRPDLERENLLWGEYHKFLQMDKFKALMRIELRKSVSAQAAAHILFIVT
jgi:hypothetical protein